MDITSFRERPEKRADEETEALDYQAIGSAIEVHRILGPGLPESVYRKALSKELTLRSIPHQCEVHFPIFYKEEVVGEGRIDILVGEKLVLELKSVESLCELHRDQCLSYLKALKLELALLMNFNVEVMRDGIKRVINTFSPLRG